MSLTPPPYLVDGKPVNSPNGVCGWVTHWEPFKYCGKQAAVHVIFDSRITESMLVCGACFDKLCSKYVYFAAHAHEPTCDMDGRAVYVEEWNRCILPETERPMRRRSLVQSSA